jgi:hypothetical protein
MTNLPHRLFTFVFTIAIALLLGIMFVTISSDSLDTEYTPLLPGTEGSLLWSIPSDTTSFGRADVLVTGRQIVPCGTRAGNTEPCTLCHLYNLAKNILDFLLFWLALPIAVLVLLGGGILLLVSTGNPSTIQRGKDAMQNAVIGLIIAFAAWIIINTILATLGFITFQGTGGPADWFEAPTCLAAIEGTGGDDDNDTAPPNNHCEDCGQSSLLDPCDEDECHSLGNCQFIDNILVDTCVPITDTSEESCDPNVDTTKPCPLPNGGNGLQGCKDSGIWSSCKEPCAVGIGASGECNFQGCGAESGTRTCNADPDIDVAWGACTDADANDGCPDGSVGGDLQTLTQQLIAEGVSFSGSGDCGPSATTNKNEMLAGNSTTTTCSCACNCSGPKKSPDPRLLQVVLTAERAINANLTINSITTGRHSCTSNHYNGNAIDIAQESQITQLQIAAAQHGCVAEIHNNNHIHVDCL